LCSLVNQRLDVVELFERIDSLDVRVVTSLSISSIVRYRPA
jgi:hypothetical protein